MAPDQPVRIWREPITIPTYPVGEPDRNPMFLEKRVYQGSSGAVYPLPFTEKIHDEPRDVEYDVVFIENRYLKIMVMPSLGGRVQLALDKTNDRPFVYYNRVIKPALVGLAGPWISGGIEFNWPQHHRPSTFEPVDHTIEEHPDGSATLWVSEIERMTRTKGMAGFRLHPDRAYLEIDVRLYNRTSEPQTFLWWANPAVAATESYQSVFPPDVHAVFDHGKRDVSRFPIATGTYYKVDYSRGVDISRWKNIPVPTSYMAFHSDYDFVGGYDHADQAGMLHVADHHVAPGKKQWVWGNGEFGEAWDRNLTDEDGPYVELMTGAFTDNQPDFSWLMPGEEKRFTQYFMPYKAIGAVKNATREAAVNLEIENGQARVGVYVTSPRPGATVRLEGPAGVLHETHGDLAPENPLAWQAPVPAELAPEELTLRLLDADGTELVRYHPEPERVEPMPEPATAAPAPGEIATNEELFLTGLHLEQYRHATRDAEPYYREALARDPGDVRNNNALGLLLYRRGRFDLAESHFRAAAARLTRRNPNPYDGEPYFNLGLTLVMQQRPDEAFDAFYKSTWNAPWQSPANLALARIAAGRGQLDYALEFLDRSLVANWHHHLARHLRVAILRRLGRLDAARREAQTALELDTLDLGVRNELVLLARTAGDDADARQLLARHTELMRGSVHNYLEIALDYARAGLWDDAIELLARFTADQPAANVYPMAWYYLGWFEQQRGRDRRWDVALDHYRRAASARTDYCFPHRLESIAVLQSAIAANPADARAPYYLGNLWYSKKQHDLAIAAWENARELDGAFPTVHRNLALAYFNKRNDPDRARRSLSQAYQLDCSDARVLFELDQLHKKIGWTPDQRLALLEVHPDVVDSRDDLYVECTTLLNLIGAHGQALDRLRVRRFHPWEGGEGKVTGAYVAALIGLGYDHLENRAYQQAIDAFQAARKYPENLGEGKLYGAQENDVFYGLARAFDALGRPEDARDFYRLASSGLDKPASAMYYNDQRPETIFYQGLAWRRLGDEDQAQSRFHRLVDYGERHLFDKVAIDYFAVSLPDFLVFDEDLDRRNEIHCRFIRGLGLLGLGQLDAGRAELERVLRLDPAHLGAALHRRWLGQNWLAEELAGPANK